MEGGINMKIAIVQTSWQKWGKEFGEIKLAPKVSGSVSGSGTQAGSADVRGSAEAPLSTTPKKDEVFPWGWMQRRHLISYDSGLFPPLVTYGIAIGGYIFLKTMKTFGIVTKLGVHLLGLEVHLAEFYVSPERMANCYKFVKYPVMGLTFLVEYIVFTWAPNLTVYPLASITQGPFVNTATMRGDPVFLDIMCLVLLLGVIAGVLVMITDKIFVDPEKGMWGPWRGSTTCSKLARCLTAFLRLLLALAVGLCVAAAVAVFKADWHLIFGIDFSASFNFSFNFGLVGWAAFLRLSIVLQTILEFGPIIYVNTLWLRNKAPAGVVDVVDALVGNEKQTPSENDPAVDV